MRESDLVKRAEQAAAAVEQAWMRWRARHCLDSGPMAPVTSYVGYSVEEPWGQPRVVFGIAADEAERLAAILDADEYVGPVHAKLTGWSERHQQPEPTSAAGPSERIGIPAQSAARDPGQAYAAAPTMAMPIGAMTLTASSSPAAAGPPTPAPTLSAAPNTPAEPQAAAATDMPVQPAQPEAEREAAVTDLRELVARTTGRPPMSQAFPSAAARQAVTADAGGQPDQPRLTGTPDPVAVQGPAPADQAEPEPAQAGAPESAGALQDADDLPAEARLVSVAGKNRPRKSVSGHDSAPWPAAKDKRRASDAAV